MRVELSRVAAAIKHVESSAERATNGLLETDDDRAAYAMGWSAGLTALSALLDIGEFDEPSDRAVDAEAAALRFCVSQCHYGIVAGSSGEHERCGCCPLRPFTIDAYIRSAEELAAEAKLVGEDEDV